MLTLQGLRPARLRRPDCDNTPFLDSTSWYYGVIACAPAPPGRAGAIGGATFEKHEWLEEIIHKKTVNV